MKADFVLFTVLEECLATKKHSVKLLNNKLLKVKFYSIVNRETGDFGAERRQIYNIAFSILEFIILEEMKDISRKRREKDSPNRRLLKLI